MRIQRVSAYIFGIRDLIRSRYGQMRGKDENGSSYTGLHTIIREASAGENRVWYMLVPTEALKSHSVMTKVLEETWWGKRPQSEIQGAKLRRARGEWLELI